MLENQDYNRDEKGYGADELDFRVVDLGTCVADVFSQFRYSLQHSKWRKLRSCVPAIESQRHERHVTTEYKTEHILATIPTLVVPLQKTLSEDVESRYKAITDSRVCKEVWIRVSGH